MYYYIPLFVYFEDMHFYHHRPDRNYTSSKISDLACEHAVLGIDWRQPVEEGETSAEHRLGQSEMARVGNSCLDIEYEGIDN